MNRCILMNPTDNVATVLQDTKAHERLVVIDCDMVQIGEIISTERIPFAHKICIQTIHQKEFVVKFGVVIGRAAVDIPAGRCAHVHNVVSIKGAENVVKGEGTT